MASRLRKNDKVMVLAGKDKGKVGKILRFIDKKNTALVEGVNKVKKHMKPNPYRNEQGGVIEKEAPIQVSNLMYLCDSCSKPSKLGVRVNEDNQKVRFCKKCSDTI